MAGDHGLELLRSGPVSGVVSVLSNNFLWLASILLRELTVSSFVLFQGIDDLGNALSESVILIEQPCLFIGKLALVILVWLFWSVLRQVDSFEEHLDIRLEEVWQ